MRAGTLWSRPGCLSPVARRGVMMGEVPLTVVAYTETVSMADDGSVTVDTCWKDVSRVRLLSVVHRCIHGTLTTPLLGAHCALRAVMILSEHRNAMDLPQVQALVRSLSYMTVCFRALSAEERTVLALGAVPSPENNVF